MIDNAVAYLILLAAVIVAIGTVGKAIHWMYRWAVRMEESQEYIEGEMRFNGGATMRDAIGRIDKENVITNVRLRNLESHLKRQDATSRERYEDED